MHTNTWEDAISSYSIIYGECIPLYAEYHFLLIDFKMAVQIKVESFHVLSALYMYYII